MKAVLLLLILSLSLVAGERQPTFPYDRFARCLSADLEFKYTEEHGSDRGHALLSEVHRIRYSDPGKPFNIDRQATSGYIALAAGSDSRVNLLIFTK